MQSKIIESVRALAEAQKKAEAPNQRYVEFSERTGEFVEAACSFDFPALLAALERAERIERAAKARKFAADMFYALPAGTSPDQWGGAIGAMRGAEADLDAALSEPQ